MPPLDGKVAMVTGASRGMGYAIATELSCAGARIIANYHPDLREGAEELVDAIEREGREAVAIGGDISRYEDCERLVKEAIGAFGYVDILVNNAGINRDRMLHRLAVEDWQAVINTDLSGAFYLIKLFTPHFKERNFGRIVNIASMIGQTGNIGQVNYAAAKAGLIALTKTAALELARNNITVNAVCPGFVATPMVAALSEEVKEAVLAKIPLGRFGKPEEIASLVRFIVSEGDWITGQQFNPNGGQYM